MRTALCRIFIEHLSCFHFPHAQLRSVHSQTMRIIMPNQLIIIIMIIMNTLTGPQEKDETARAALMKPVAERWCKTNANPLKDLRYLPRSHIYVNSFFKYGALAADERERDIKWEAIKQDACEHPQLLRLWWLNAGTSHVCIVPLTGTFRFRCDEVIVTATFDSNGSFIKFTTLFSLNHHLPLTRC